MPDPRAASSPHHLPSSPAGPRRFRARGRRRLTPALIAAAASFASSMPAARAADTAPPERVTGIGAEGGQLTISVGLQDLFGQEERRHLTSGFSSRVLIRVALEERDSDEPVALSVQRAEVVYDIWDEKFSVRVTRGLGSELRLLAATADDAIARAAALWHFPVADLGRLRPGVPYVVRVRGDLNPISEDLVAEVRRWLLLPTRGQRRLAAGDSFFGSFVSIFVNPRIEDSERQVRFSSQAFVLAPDLFKDSSSPPARGTPGAATTPAPRGAGR